LCQKEELLDRMNELLRSQTRCSMIMSMLSLGDANACRRTLKRDQSACREMRDECASLRQEISVSLLALPVFDTFCLPRRLNFKKQDILLHLAGVCGRSQGSAEDWTAGLS